MRSLRTAAHHVMCRFMGGAGRPRARFFPNTLDQLVCEIGTVSA
jgi:hypothetical protein